MSTIEVSSLYSYTPVDKENEHEFGVNEEFILEYKKGYDDWELAYRSDDPNKTQRYIAMSMFIKYEDGVVESESYFYDVSRNQAERILASEKCGTFLIRRNPDAKVEGSFVMSLRSGVKDLSRDFGHWPIRTAADGTVYVLASEKYAFDSAAELVAHYYTKAKEENDPIIIVAWPKRNILPVPFRNFIYSENFIEKLEKAKQHKDVYDGGYFYHTGKSGHEHYPDILVKKYSLVEDAEPVLIESIIQEISELKKYSHPNIAQVMGVCLLQNELEICTEMDEIGKLSVFVSRQAFRDLHYHQYLWILEQVASGMAYLEANGMFHGDLRTRNIYLYDKFEAKIANFGIPRIMSRISTSHVITDEDRWIAPESIDGQCDIKSDVYLFAILMYEIFCHTPLPHPPKDLQNGTIYAMDDKEDPFLETNVILVHKRMFNYLAINCWYKDPTRRLSFSQLKYFFETYNPLNKIDLPQL